MSGLIKIGAAFVLGAAAGVVASRGYFKKKYSEEADVEIEKMVNDIHAKLEQMKGESDNDSEKEVVDDISEVVDKVTSESNWKSYVDKVSVNYNKAAISELDRTSESGPTKEQAENSPYFIEARDFVDECIHYTKMEDVMYYQDDDILCDESGTIMDIDRSVGYENIEAFADSTEKFCYIRNPGNSCDYEITKIDGSYKDDYPGASV